MNSCNRIFYICLTCVLLAVAHSADIGTGALEYDEVGECFKVITCFMGEEGFDMTRECYDWLDAQDREEGKEIILIAAEIANVSFTKDILDEQRAEYCSYTEEEKQIMYKEITGPLVDKFASLCSSYKTRKQCSHFENFLDCGLTLMEKMSAEKKCVISEFKK